MKTDTIFEKIYQLTRKNKYDDALQLIFDSKIKDIYEEYKTDENHAWYIVADLFYKMNNLECSKKSFIKALEIWSEDIDAHIGLSNILNEQENYEEASKILKKALLISNDPRIIYNYANNLFDQGYFSQAIHEYKKVVAAKNKLSNLALKNLQKAEKLLKN